MLNKNNHCNIQITSIWSSFLDYCTETSVFVLNLWSNRKLQTHASYKFISSNPSHAPFISFICLFTLYLYILFTAPKYRPPHVHMVILVQTGMGRWGLRNNDCCKHLTIQSAKVWASFLPSLLCEHLIA